MTCISGTWGIGGTPAPHAEGFRVGQEQEPFCLLFCFRSRSFEDLNELIQNSRMVPGQKQAVHWRGQIQAKTYAQACGCFEVCSWAS